MTPHPFRPTWAQYATSSLRKCPGRSRRRERRVDSSYVTSKVGWLGLPVKDCRQRPEIDMPVDATEMLLREVRRKPPNAAPSPHLAIESRCGCGARPRPADSRRCWSRPGVCVGDHDVQCLQGEHLLHPLAQAARCRFVIPVPKIAPTAPAASPSSAAFTFQAARIRFNRIESRRDCSR